MPDKNKKKTKTTENKSKKNSKSVQATANEVPPELLRWKCDDGCLQFETTAEIDPAIGVVGQPTASEALKFGIECLSPGQNVYVRGARGTGRNTMVRQMLRDLRPESDSNRDFCYVHNFSRPDHPRLITLPPGTANQFRKEMVLVAEFFEEGLIKSLDGEPYRGERQAVQDRLQENIKQATEPLEKEIEANGMAMVQVQQGPATQTLIMPVVGGEPIPPEQLKTLIAAGKVEPEQLTQYEEALPKYQKQMLETGRQVSELIRSATREIHDQMEKVARQLTGNFTRTVLEKFPTEAVKIYIGEVIDDVVENHLQSDSEQRPDFRELYSVNVVLSQDDKTLRPVVEENTPSLINLLGTVDPQKPNNLLTGRWLLTLEDSPNAMRFVEVSPSGNVTCYKMDGKTIDAVPGYQENWTVKGNIIESISQGPSPPKPLLTMMTQATSKMISGDRNPLERARYGYKMKDDSTLQLELLDSPTPQCVTLTRVSASNEQHDMTSNKANEHQSLEK